MNSVRRLTFSIVIETANLSASTLNNLHACLASLNQQDPSPTEANEVLLLESGGVPQDRLQRLRHAYPWLTIQSLELGTDYGQMKARSAELATGEVLVLCDSDCRFEADWLKNILAPFTERDDIHIVAGETTTPIRTPHDLAIALTFIFPRFSRDQKLLPSKTYWANNVAVRRNTLWQLPVPDQFPVFRGQNIIHSARLSELGHTIWRNPRARAFHVVPTLGEMPQRFFILGNDAVNLTRFARDTSGEAYRGDMAPDLMTGGRFRKFLGRVQSVFVENPRVFLYLPFALPIIGVGALCYYAGRFAAQRQISSAPLPVPSR